MPRKKTSPHPVSDDPWDRNLSPWGQEADYESQRSSQSFEVARDAVIISYLEHGDLRPLASLLMQGKAPSAKVLQFLGAMMGARYEGEYEKLPFTLEPKNSEKGTRRISRENLWRDKLIALNVKGLIDQGEKYEFAIHTVLEMLQGEDPTLGKKSIRNAYDRYKQSI